MLSKSKKNKIGTYSYARQERLGIFYYFYISKYAVLIYEIENSIKYKDMKQTLKN